MNPADEARVRRFFSTHLKPTADSLRSRGMRFFDLGPAPEAPTWFAAAPLDQDFVEIAESRLEQTLHQLWNAQGFPELAALARPLMQLSRELEVQAEQTPDISPYVYVMY